MMTLDLVSMYWNDTKSPSTEVKMDNLNYINIFKMCIKDIINGL
jgi:hypothetical protein